MQITPEKVRELLDDLNSTKWSTMDKQPHIGMCKAYLAQAEELEQLQARYAREGNALEGLSGEYIMEARAALKEELGEQALFFDDLIQNVIIRVKKVEEENQRFLEIIEKLREALEFYANKDNWIDGKPMIHGENEISPGEEIESLIYRGSEMHKMIISGKMSYSYPDNGKTAREALALTAKDKPK